MGVREGPKAPATAPKRGRLRLEGDLQERNGELWVSCRSETARQHLPGSTLQIVTVQGGAWQVRQGGKCSRARANCRPPMRHLGHEAPSV